MVDLPLLFVKSKTIPLSPTIFFCVWLEVGRTPAPQHSHWKRISVLKEKETIGL